MVRMLSRLVPISPRRARALSSVGRRPCALLGLILLAIACTPRPEAPEDGGLEIGWVEPGSAMAAAGLREGDRLRGWSVADSAAVGPAAHARSSGPLETLHDWRWLVAEVGPLSAVELELDRSGKRHRLTLGAGAWSGELRPVLSAEERADLGRLESLEGEDAPDAVLTAARAWREIGRREQARDLLSRFVGQLPRAAAELERWGEQVEAPAERGRWWAELGRAHLRGGKPQDAARAAAKAGDLLSEAGLGGTLEAAGVLALEGIARERLYELDRADGLFREALSIQRERAPGSVAVAQTLTAWSRVAWLRDRQDEAARRVREARDLWLEHAPASRESADALSKLGVLSLANGAMRDSQVHLEEALTIERERAPQGVMMGRILNNLGGLAIAGLDYEAASTYLLRALAIKEGRGGEPLDLVSTLQNLGDVALHQGELPLAEGYYRRILELVEHEAAEGLLYASSIINLGLLALETGELGEARRHFERALEVHLGRAPHGMEAAFCYYHLGEVAAEERRFEESEALYLEALRRQEVLSPFGSPHVITLRALGDLAYRVESWTEALDFYRRTVELIEDHLGILARPHDRQTVFRAQFSAVFHRYAVLLVERGRKTEALEVLERSRARSLLDRLSVRDAMRNADVPEELVLERRQLAARFDALQAQLAEEAAVGDPRGLEELRRELRELRRERDDLADRLVRSTPHLADVHRPRPLEFGQILRALDAGTVLLAYSVGEEETLLFVLPAGGELEVAVLPVGEPELRFEIERLNRMIREGSHPSSLRGERRSRSITELGRRLAARLLTPAMAAISESERVLVLADGPLHLLPFCALPPPREGREERWRFLVEYRPLHYAYSVTTYARLREIGARRATGSDEAVVVFGAPPAPEDRPDLSALPGAREEALAIAARFPAGRALLGGDATEANAKRVGFGPRYLHFATHALLDERFPTDSALVLAADPAAGSEGENGLLQAWEILEQVRIDAELVVLSGCETALGREVRGEGLLSLTRAFQVAGARSVVASLWRVRDRATRELMEAFYRGLNEGLPKDEALRAAQIEAIGRAPLGRSAAALHSWAAFQLNGDWRSPSTSGDHSDRVTRSR